MKANYLAVVARPVGAASVARVDVAVRRVPHGAVELVSRTL